MSANTVSMASPTPEVKESADTTKEITKETPIEMYFVEVKTIGSTGRQPKTMQSAFVALKSVKFGPNWIKEEEVFDKEWSENCENLLFVLDSFDSKVFDFLISKKLRIISPLTVLYCYSKDCPKPQKSIPVKPFPVFSQCMRKLFVSLSGFEGQRKQEMVSKITRMCGNFCKDFTKNVTHLVTDSVRTKKYKVAKEKGVAVVSPLWIEDCWAECQHNLMSADDPLLIDKHKLKIFNKLLISVSRIEIEERKRVERLVSQNGGQYSPSLKLNDPNSVLLLRTPDGDKFKYAHMRGVPCLNVQWLYDSHEKGYALPEDEYLIRPLSQSSKQLSQNSQKTQQLSEKRDSNDNQMTTNPLNDSSLVESTSNPKTSEDLSQETIIRLTADKDNEAFLEGCDIFVVGFDAPTFERLKAALISCGSMVYNEFKNLVTHVIVGPKCGHKEIQRFFDHKACKVVSIEWVLECFKLNECCDCTPFELKNPGFTQNCDSNSSQGRKRKANDLFGGPLTVVLPKRAHRALEKWREESKIDAKHNHKSLGSKMNEKNQVHWSEHRDDDEEEPSN